VEAEQRLQEGKSRSGVSGLGEGDAEGGSALAAEPSLFSGRASFRRKVRKSALDEVEAS
jgi:hypothetical protein